MCALVVDGSAEYAWPNLRNAISVNPLENTELRCVSAGIHLLMEVLVKPKMGEEPVRSALLFGI